jgi:hypothetical protein
MPPLAVAIGLVHLALLAGQLAGSQVSKLLQQVGSSRGSSSGSGNNIGVSGSCSGFRGVHVVVAAGVLLHHEFQHALMFNLFVQVAGGVIMQVLLDVFLSMTGDKALQLALSKVGLVSVGRAQQLMLRAELRARVAAAHCRNRHPCDWQGGSP